MTNYKPTATILTKLKFTLFTAALFAALTLVQGCAVLLLGGVAAGTAYGTVEYVDNTLKVTQEVGLDKAWTAAKAALRDMNIPVARSAKDAASGKLEARNARNQPVTLELTRQTDTVTVIEITVGTFDSAENRTEAQQIYDKMTPRF